MTGAKRRLDPRKRPRQRRSEETRHRILQAATHVFADYGYEAGTTNRIAEFADVSIGSLYQYYPNKDAILLDLATRHLDAGVELDDRLRAPDASPSLHDVVGAMVRNSIENHRADPEFLRVLMEQAPRSAGLMAKVAEVKEARTARLRDIMARSPEVTVDDQTTAAHLVVTTVEMVVHHLLAGPEPIDPERLEAQLIEMLSRYLTAPGDAL